ncbi:ATP-binding cassette domain-containing protein [Acidiferrimicrobium sp. IK]|uniref:oligopeptide/dipeptide ABC transporter ATP-binding protein n=1 Tax=Acidiferrimicrobium sp. IK TaxID=2871700 RepID=UPI0021CB1166|nr:oligopeptide/dipeptide ABC transporter ATP-binding protein [Acidiferrimicrobium sp. IK]MCU4183330.1 ATP-binding cassette domain-containing protein [Acidiferrimicrobium sp. IK]
MTAPAPSTAAAPAVVALDGVSVRFSVRTGAFRPASVHALTDATIAVRAGETLGVVGESGCGKSTLARVLIGLERPSQGRVRYGEQDLWAMRAGERRRRVGKTLGMVFQDPATSLNRRMSVEQILRDPLDVHRWRSPAERDRRVAELLDLVGLPKSVTGVLPHQLSGGQRQRVAIGRALALEPEVLVADEPTSALDVSVRAQVLNLLLDLKATLGLGMVYISHDIQTVRLVADRVVTMYLGRIVEETPAAAIPDATRHPYSRALLSATPSLLNAVAPIPLSGPVPSAVHPPSGCPFGTRCWRATERCAAAMPPVTDDGSHPGHRYRCYHPVLADSDLVGARSQELN